MAETVTEIHPPQAQAQLPAVVKITKDYSPQFTPRELDMIRDQTGRSYSQIVADDESDEKFTITAWLTLRRAGHDIRLEQMRDVVIELGGDADPTSGERSSSS